MRRWTCTAGPGCSPGCWPAEVGPTGTVIGIESDRAAVRDARHNLRDTPWARIHRGDVAEVLGQAGWSQASVAVLDPPRSGAGRAVLDQLLRPGHAPCAGSPTCPATRPRWPGTS